MKTIHKHRLETSSEAQQLKLSAEGVVREVAYIQQERALYLWVEVPAGSVIDANQVERSFKVFLTGDGIPEHAIYLGTALDPMAPEAFHVYELAE
ncbi:MAG TPA: hypothetical protein VK099_07650 [Alcanivoracaceae bacterium]|nr:hypothetical protein [Alcanivoracaceae bacterium]